MLIQGWFFILSKHQHPTLEPNQLDCEIKAIFGETQDIINDTGQLAPNTLVSLRVQKNHHREIAKKLQTASCVFITGKMHRLKTHQYIEVEKIYPSLNNGDIAHF